MRLIVRVAFVAMILLGGCDGGSGPSEQERKLDETYNFSARELRRVGRDDMAAMSWQSAIESGATPVDYVVAASPENMKFANLVWEAPAAPWTVVVKNGPGANDLTIEAFGEATDKPTRSETIDMAAKPRVRQ